MTNDEMVLTALARTLVATGDGRASRERAGLTIGEVARAIGASTSTVWRWEHRERTPRGAAAVAWARLIQDLNKAHRKTARGAA